MADWREDNPAGRLHASLVRLKAVPGNTDIRTAMAQVLDVAEGEPDHMLFPKIADFVDLIRLTEAEMSRFPDVNQELYLRWLGPAKEGVAWSGRFADAVSHMQANFTEANMLSLEHCADFLHQRAPEIVLEADAIDGLIDLVRDAIDAILADENLPAALRHHLVGRLRDVESALQSVRITGYAGVQQAMEAFTGAIVMSPDARNSEPTKSWWAKLWAAVSLGSNGVKELSESTESVMKAIGAVGGGG